jgi:cell fate regulator YaaT (PSP1 superfamily)
MDENFDINENIELNDGEITENTPAVSSKDKADDGKKTEVVGVRFKKSGKTYYFAPEKNQLRRGDFVIVETARGLEFATVTMSLRTVKGSEVVLPLRKLVRIATENDERRHEDNLAKETEAFNTCLSKIETHRLEMKLVDVEYAFDNSKLLFYFTSEGRVDFRDLVKDLAAIFRTRIELRQIGIRDEAKLLGGIGVCGRPFCCKSFLPDFVQVSIKMAKEQSLSLNSTKISGACGRLMCCLRYEYDTYVAESSITPKVDAIVETPDGEGVVTESLPLKGIVKVALDKDPTVIRVYHRDDLTVKGHQKGKHKTVGKNADKQKNDDKQGQNKKN